MRILYVITKANWGGAQKYVYDLATAAKATGHEVAVVVGGNGVLREKLASDGIRVISLPLNQQRSFVFDVLTFGSLFSLIQIFRREHPDLVHVNSAKAGGLGAFAARLARVPRIIFTAHGWEFNAPRNPLSKAGIIFFSWLTVLLSHETIAVSEAIRRDTRWWPFVGRRVTVVRNGIACQALLSREGARAALAPRGAGKYWLGMMSELNATKRVADAINAFARIAPRHPEAILLVLGEGNERENLEFLIHTLHLSNRISLLGFRTDAPSLLAAFDLFVHSSVSESLGLAILEAGCARLPVVATRVGGIPEIIPDDGHGLLVPPRDPQALATAMESLMNDPRRAIELGARLHARVHNHFSKERMLAETLRLYS